MQICKKFSSVWKSPQLPGYLRSSPRVNQTKFMVFVGQGMIFKNFLLIKMVYFI